MSTVLPEESERSHDISHILRIIPISRTYHCYAPNYQQYERHHGPDDGLPSGCRPHDFRSRSSKYYIYLWKAPSYKISFHCCQQQTATLTGFRYRNIWKKSFRNQESTILCIAHLPILSLNLQRNTSSSPHITTYMQLWAANHYRFAKYFCLPL